MRTIGTIAIIYLLVAYFLSWSPFEKYELHKFYKDPLSPAAVFMGGTYAGIVDSYSTWEECFETKARAEKDDAAIGYTNSIFKCKKK